MANPPGVGEDPTDGGTVASPSSLGLSTKCTGSPKGYLTKQQAFAKSRQKTGVTKPPRHSHTDPQGGERGVSRAPWQQSSSS